MFLQRILSIVFLITLIGNATRNYAQSPKLFNYQGIARDGQGQPLSGKTLSLQIGILPTADAVQTEYEEVHTVTTNDFGLYTLQIGAGKKVSGELGNVKWESGNKYIRVAIDPNGGQQFAVVGVNQLLSVPYALYADKAGETSGAADHGKTRAGAVSTAAAGTGTTNYITKFTAANTIYNSQIFDNGTNIGIGTITPSSKLHLYNSIGNIEHIRMQNTNGSGYGKFMMFNDVAGNYATFTKYGSLYPGGYPGVASQFPYANMLAFGNNLGPFLLANNGNVGIGIVTGGTTKLYFNAQQNTGYLGIGGSALPAANVHFNNNTTGDTLRITNATTGHTAGDGLEIRNSGNTATIVNNENSNLNLGAGNFPSILSLTPAGNAEVSGLLKVAGGSPSFGYVLTSDANGLASWQVPASTLPNGSANGNTPFWNGSTWLVNNNHLYNDGNRIGINTASPLMRTHINDNSGKVLLLGSETPLATGVQTGQYFKTGDYYTGAVRTTGTSATSARLGLYTNADTATANLRERLTIAETGYVGINDTTPNYTLDVAGTVHAQYAYVDYDLYANYIADYGDCYIDGVLDVDSDVNFDSDLNVEGEVTVSNGQGLVKSNSSAQRNVGYVTGGFSYTNMASNNFGDITFALPDITGTVNSVKVSIAQFVPTAGSGDGWRHFILTVHSVDVVSNTCKVSVFNAGSNTATINGTLHMSVIYND